MNTEKNIDRNTVIGFGEEWERFSHETFSQNERNSLFEKYFSIFPTACLQKEKIGADIGCGSGRWATIVAPSVKNLHVLDASEKALNVAKKNLNKQVNVIYHLASVGELPFENNSLDFAYSLGVLHHVPNTESALLEISRTLKVGAPLLLYLYYAFDNRPLWYRLLWLATNLWRKMISKLPFRIRLTICQVIAAGVYYPLAKTAAILDNFHCLPRNWPLSFYRNSSFYVMQTDALDRFGTRLEQRFTRAEITLMMNRAGFENIEFSPNEPHWVAIGYKKGLYNA